MRDRTLGNGFDLWSTKLSQSVCNMFLYKCLLTLLFVISCVHYVKQSVCGNAIRAEDARFWGDFRKVMASGGTGFRYFRGGGVVSTRGWSNLAPLSGASSHNEKDDENDEDQDG
jgi:hypothetical protein